MKPLVSSYSVSSYGFLSTGRKTFSFYDNYEYYQFTLKRLKDNMFRMITYDKKEYLCQIQRSHLKYSNSKDVFIQLKGKGKSLPTRPYQAKESNGFSISKEKTFLSVMEVKFTLKRLKDNIFCDIR